MSDLDKEFDSELDLDAEFDSELDLNTPASVEDPGMIESGLRGAAQGITLGFADEIAGGVESLLTDKTYEQARDESRAAFKAAQEANPLTYGAGELGGGVGSMLIPGLGAAKLAKGATTGAKLLSGAKTGAKLGGLYGAGVSEGETAAEVTGDAATGAAGGALLSVAMPTLFGSMSRGQTLKESSKKLATAMGAGAATGVGLDIAAGGEDDLAQSAALGALGAGTAKALLGTSRAAADSYMGRDFSSLWRRGAREGIDITDDLYRATQEEKVVTEAKKLAKQATDKTRNFYKQVDQAKDDILDARKLMTSEGKQKLTKLADQADTTVREVADDIGKTFDLVEKQAAQRNLVFRPARVTEEFLSELDNPNNAVLSTLDDKVKSNLREVFRKDAFTGKADIKEVKTLKNTLSSYIDSFEDNLPVKRELTKVYQKLNQSIADDLVEQGAEDVAQTLRTTNERWGAAQQLKDFLKVRSKQLKDVETGERSRINLLKRLPQEESELSLGRIRELAKTAEGPKPRLTELFDEASTTAQQLDEVSRPISQADLTKEAYDVMGPQSRQLRDQVRKAEQFLGPDLQDKATKEFVGDAPWSRVKRLGDTLELSTEPQGRATKAKLAKETYETLEPLVGKEAIDEFTTKAQDAAERLDEIRMYTGRGTGEAGVSPTGFARQAVGGDIGRFLGRGINKVGKVTYDAKQWTKSLADDQTVQALVNRADSLGLSKVGNVLKSLQGKDLRGRSAIMFTLMQRPDLRQELDQLTEGE